MTPDAESSTPEEAEPRSFAEARERLDAILAELEDDASDVDQLAARLREASDLIRYCRRRLSAARAEVQQIVAELDAEERPAGDVSASELPAQPAPPEEGRRRRRSEGSGTSAGLPF